MSHDYHPGLDGYDPEAILFDRCEECEARSRKGVKGLLDLDSTNLELLWRRCLNTSYSVGLKGGEEAGKYRSDCEARLGHQLYLIGVLLQRQDPNVWRPETFESPVRIVS